MLRRVYLHRDALGWIALLFLQQTIVASSTVWMARLAERIASGAPVTGPLLLVLASLLLPYVPGALLLLELERWTFATQARFFDVLTRRLFHRPALWSNRDKERDLVALYAKEGPRTVEDFGRYLYEVAAKSLNVLFNVAVISFVADARFVVVYVVSLGLAALAIRLQAARNEALAHSAEKQRMHFTGVLVDFWDNVTLGNAYNREVWTARFRTSFEAAKRTVLRAEGFQQTVSIAIALLTYGPVFALLVGTLAFGDLSRAQALAIVVVIPRTFQILNYSQELLASLASFSTFRGRVRLLQEGLSNLDDTTVGRIDFPALAVQHLGKRTIIRGPNGSGKTSILLQLKERFGSSAFYLPAEHHLAFARAGEAQSTGERAASALEEIIAKSNVKLLLLDEWDANLDPRNIEALERQIEKAAHSGLEVVEVRHRFPQ